MSRFKAQFTITSVIARDLMRIEAAREAVRSLPITPKVLATLRETARLFSTHYSTQIEGNLLTQEQVSKVVEDQVHIPGRERDEKEVLGYYAALWKVEQLATARLPITQKHVQQLHALTMAGGSRRAKPSEYRDGQNVIRDSQSRAIVYMPPEAKDVPKLMKELVGWLQASEKEGLPCPLRAAIAHYQFATIHPYYDGNGRTARLLTTLVLHLGGYDLKGLYSLEEYYARRLNAYYEALSVGPSHNYYMGREQSDITGWVDYFCRGMAESFESVKRRAEEAAGMGAEDRSPLLRKLDPKKRRVLELFLESELVTSRDVEKVLLTGERTTRNVLTRWVEEGFLVVADPAKKSRKYRLASEFEGLI